MSTKMQFALFQFKGLLALIMQYCLLSGNCWGIALTTCCTSFPLCVGCFNEVEALIFWDRCAASDYPIECMKCSGRFVGLWIDFLPGTDRAQFPAPAWQPVYSLQKPLGVCKRWTIVLPYAPKHSHFLHQSMQHDLFEWYRDIERLLLVC